VIASFGADRNHADVRRRDGEGNGRGALEDEARHSKAVLVLEPPAPGGIVRRGRKGNRLFTVEAKALQSPSGLG